DSANAVPATASSRRVTPGERGFGAVPDNRGERSEQPGPDVVEGPVDRATGETAAPSALRGNPGGSSGPAGSHVHVGAVVDSHAACLDALVPFVDEGLRAGDLTVLSCPVETVEEILETLGERAGPIESDARISLVGLRPPDALVV